MERTGKPAPEMPQMDRLREQYSRWVYPKPRDDLGELTYEMGDPACDAGLFWPRGKPRDSLDILIAGCGSFQAAMFARTNPSDRVLGIDISGPSLEHNALLKDRHGLENLELMQHDLLQVSALGRSFDYIVSSGVLHHLVDPDAGLRALRDVLRPHGSMCLMLYNAHARHGIYMLQEAFRILGFGQVQADVDLVKATLAALPAHHQAKLMAADSEDLKYDAGVVDMLLHPQDRPYTVKECYEFLERNGLRFQVWADPLDFSVQANVPADHPLYRRLAMLPKREQAHAIDLLYQRRPTNVFLACHPGRTDTDLDFTGEAFLGYVPSVRQPIEMSIVRNVVQEEVVRVKRRWSDITLPRKASLVISRVDGAKTCRQIIEEIAGDATVEQAASVIRHTFSDLADMGHLLFRAKP